ncbi:TetR/AcrR family transcriptional regulator [Halalkalibacter sp. APA_J-10(15)]|uniref:TetR/AcrR family transcriptional regulator n=1 Tax=Halalkalibacter sp. APA_J-10(15) TaxID=2933805 RepID=UPI001FF6B1D9|nr:TetR/AcrR family transcriptional regulator [Halalkalibacter sp. APA_J-10(15)]MCK0472774.1 TetR/AcrR family transcriptional regulator [Halalkalibacter sp. APA_J-10(15)]
MKKTKAEAEATIETLIETARKQFAVQGFYKTSLEELVKEAGVTRGALYHHFTNKKSLFLTVFERIQSEMAKNVELEAVGSTDVWAQLLNGCQAFILSAINEENRQIILIDGPAVLGWETWRQMDASYSMKLLNEQLHTMQKNGHLKPTSIEALTHILSGAMNESALWLAQQFDYRTKLKDVMDVLTETIYTFKQHS